jgi:amylosucrase
LATRDTGLMTHVLATHFPDRLTNATYATYIRCHDDIGWAITDEDTEALGLTGVGHRSYLSDFYEGGFPGSFAQGVPFQVNEATGDKRISGSFASLAGMEKYDGFAEQRMLMGHALIAAFGGIPLIYMGDELAMLNDYSYRDDPDLAHDSRWVHRPRMDWALAADRHSGNTASSRVFLGTKHILARRRATPGLHAASPTQVLDAGNAAMFAVQRQAPTAAILCLFNFSENWQHISGDWLRANGVVTFHDELSDAPVQLHGDQLALPPFARVWLT